MIWWVQLRHKQTKKRNIYDEMAQILVPYDVSGNIQNFDKDGDILNKWRH